MRPIPVVRAVALAMAVVSGTLAVLLAGPAVARAATLTIEIQTGAGTITANQGAIECTRQASDGVPPACDFMVGATDKITLLAKPAPDQQFFRWGDLNCGRQPTCQVDMAGMSQTIDAGFAPSRTLNVLAVGDGTVTLSRPAIDLTRDDFAATSDCPRSAENPSPDDTNIAGCLFAFLPGTTVTLRAAPTDVGTTSFARWSPFDCSGTGPCTVSIGDEDVTVAALFDPLQLGVRIAGAGTVSVEPGGLTCSAPAPPDDPSAQCFKNYAPGTPVTLTATTPGATWVVGCDPAPDNQTCTTTVDRNPWWVGVTFPGGSLSPSDFPPKIHVNFRVLVSGRGTVRGLNVNCGTSCSHTYDYGDRERLSVDPDRGWHFDRWEGGCGTQAPCTLPVGRVTTVRALFAADGQQNGGGDTQPPPGPVVVDPRAPQTFSARRVRLTARGRRARRRVVLVVAVNESAGGRLRLRRGRRRVAAGSVRLHRGRNRLTLKVPRRARRGRYRVVLVIRAASGTRTVSGTVQLGR